MATHGKKKKNQMYLLMTKNERGTIMTKMHEHC